MLTRAKYSKRTQVPTKRILLSHPEQHTWSNAYCLCYSSKVVIPSTLVQTGRAPAEVHQPSRWAGKGQSGGYNVQYCRSYSLESTKEPVLSRRQILASLEEDNGFSGIPPPSPSLSSSCTWSSSSPPDSENSFSGSPCSSEGVFSRACLIQSLGRGEEERQG